MSRFKPHIYWFAGRWRADLRHLSWCRIEVLRASGQMLKLRWWLCQRNGEVHDA